MTKAKKALGVLLAFVMLLSTMVIGVMAAPSEAPATEKGSLVLTVDPSAVDLAATPNATVKVTVSATANFFVGPVQIPVYFDNTSFALDGDVVVNDAFGAGNTGKEAADNGKGCVTVGLFPKDKAVKLDASTELFSFTLKVLPGAKASNEIGVHKEDQRTAANRGGKLFMGSYKTDVVDKISVRQYGQTLDFAQATKTVTVTGGGPVATPELQLSDAAQAGIIIDKTSTCTGGNGFIYGIDIDPSSATIDDIAANFTTPAGSIRVTANAQGMCSTGTTIELLDESGSVVETYFFVFFGDVNGDGFVDGFDVGTVDGVASYMDFSYSADDGSVESIASDTNGDAFIDGFDVGDIDGVASYMVFTTQAEFAQTVATAKGIA